MSKTMTTVVIREAAEGGVVMSWHRGEMPAHHREVFDDEMAAKSAHPELMGQWELPDADADRDVLVVCCF